MAVKVEGIFNALLFLTALIFISINEIGVLSYPGFAIAIMAIYYSLKSKYIYSSCLGILTALGSFLVQYLTAFCSYCTIAATAFLIGGLLSLVFLKSKSICFNLSLLIISIVAVLLLVFNLPHYEQNPIVAQPVVMNEHRDKTNKAILYISPDCRSCRAITEKFIEFDPEGLYWQPVIVPAVSLLQGEAILKEKGYTGEIQSTFNSPTRFVPLLEINGQYYRDNEIEINKIRKGAGS